MEFKCETAYNQEALSIMAKVIRKTARKKRSKRSHVLGVIICIFALLLTLPLGDKEFVLDFRTIITWIVVAILFFTLIFEDKIINAQRVYNLLDYKPEYIEMIKDNTLLKNTNKNLKEGKK